MHPAGPGEVTESPRVVEDAALRLVPETPRADSPLARGLSRFGIPAGPNATGIGSADAVRIGRMAAQFGVAVRVRRGVIVEDRPGETERLGALLLAEDPLLASVATERHRDRAGPAAVMSAREALRVVAGFSDDLGHAVDPGVRLAVAGLVRVGARTDNSCEGHGYAGLVHPPRIEGGARDGVLVEEAVGAAGLARELPLMPEEGGARDLVAAEWADAAARILSRTKAVTSPTWLPLGRVLAGDQPPEARARLARAADLHNRFAAPRVARWQASFRRLGTALLR